MTHKSSAKPHSPFRCFNSSPEVIRLVALMYVRFPFWLRPIHGRSDDPAATGRYRSYVRNLLSQPRTLPASR